MFYNLHYANFERFWKMRKITFLHLLLESLYVHKFQVELQVYFQDGYLFYMNFSFYKTKLTVILRNLHQEQKL